MFSTLNSNKIKYIEKTYAEVLIAENGYKNFSELPEGGPENEHNYLFATIKTWGTNTGCFNVTPVYCIGNPNVKITKLKVRFWYFL